MLLLLAYLSIENKKKQRGGKSLQQQLSRVDERLKKVLETHPLKIELRIRILSEPIKAGEEDGHAGKDDPWILLTFSYLNLLKVLAVKIELILGKEAKGLTPDKEVIAEILENWFFHGSEKILVLSRSIQSSV